MFCHFHLSIIITVYYKMNKVFNLQSLVIYFFLKYALNTLFTYLD